MHDPGEPSAPPHPSQFTFTDSQQHTANRITFDANRPSPLDSSEYYFTNHDGWELHDSTATCSAHSSTSGNIRIMVNGNVKTSDGRKHGRLVQDARAMVTHWIQEWIKAHPTEDLTSGICSKILPSILAGNVDTYPVVQTTRQSQPLEVIELPFDEWKKGRGTYTMASVIGENGRNLSVRFEFPKVE